MGQDGRSGGMGGRDVWGGSQVSLPYLDSTDEARVRPAKLLRAFRYGATRIPLSPTIFPQGYCTVSAMVLRSCR
eukprot:3937538-Rhodomonas_salina.1